MFVSKTMITFGAFPEVHHTQQGGLKTYAVCRKGCWGVNKTMTLGSEPALEG